MGNPFEHMFVNTRERSEAPEIMDDFAMEGEVLRDALDRIADINRFLGGNRVTLQGLLRLLPAGAENRVISILDVGCGNGDMLRMLARYGEKRGLKFRLKGIDANSYTIAHAKSLSVAYPEMGYVCGDIFELMEQDEVYDVILCTLTLHHFKDDVLLDLMDMLERRAGMGVVINDLHRSAWAYYLFRLVCLVFGLGSMPREDGLISILRGFKRKDLENYSRQLKFKKYTIRWKWAFRYQWLISTR